DEFVELQVKCLGIAALRALYQEDHQKRDDRRAGIDHQLPSVRPAEERAGAGPKYDDRHRDRECDRRSHLALGPTGEPREADCAGLAVELMAQVEHRPLTKIRICAWQTEALEEQHLCTRQSPRSIGGIRLHETGKAK